MNNRQAGAHREQILKEQRAREVWMRNNMGLLESTGQLDNYTNPGNQYPPASHSSRPSSAKSNRSNRPQSASVSGRPQSGERFVPSGDYDPNVYDHAVRVSSPRMAEDDEEDAVPRYVQRKVTRQIEVPFTRQVKVPVKTRKIVPTRVQKKVRTKKLVEIPSFKMVDETYTELVDEPAVRNKEIWVKKVVPERYMKKVPVTRVRQVKVPTTEIREVDDFEIVEVAGSQAVEVDGFRVDNVESTKMMEVEEFQRFDLRPHASGPARVVGHRDMGPVRGANRSRQVGQEVYHVQDERHRDIELDSQMGDDHARGASRPPSRGGRPASHGGWMRPSSAPASRGHRASTAHPGHRQSHRQSRGQLGGPGPRMAFDAYQAAPEQPPSGKVGLKLKDTQQNGVLVVRVHAGEAGEAAGVHSNDIITYVNNRPTRNLQEFRQVLNNANGPLNVQVRRQGGQKLMLNIMR